MNKLRRKAINKLYEQLEEIREAITEIAEEEEEAFNNIPESLEGTERYEAAEAANDNLQSALDSFDELMDYLLEAIV
jgi:formiminotetrahydrofolate cyclodeaminase